MVAVPNSYQPYVKQAASGTGLPYNVVAAQAQAESGFRADAISSAGAEGWLQFEPATYNAYAPKAGVAPGTEFNVADETKVYIQYMRALLQQEGGSIFKSLEAYNAGPGNLQAGAGYASGILRAAGVSENAQAGGGTNTSTSADVQPAGLIPGIPGIPGLNDIIGGVFGAVLKAFGVPSFKDMFQRLGLIIFGAVLIYVGIRILNEGNKGGSNNGGSSQSGGGGGNAQRTKRSKPQEEEKPSTKVLSPNTETSTGELGDLGAGEAVEAAAVA